MATADSVKEKLQALITKANEATGNTDADLTLAIDSLVAGYGQGDGISGVTVIKGTYIHTSRLHQVYLEHNIGEIRPFLFYMKAKTTELQNYGYGLGIYNVICGVLTFDAEEVTYIENEEEKTAQQTIGSFSRISLCNSSVLGNVSTIPGVLDEASTSSSNYKINMWPNGFNLGLYRNLLREYEYEYTLIYGDLFGGLT